MRPKTARFFLFVVTKMYSWSMMGGQEETEWEKPNRSKRSSPKGSIPRHGISTSSYDTMFYSLLQVGSDPFFGQAVAPGGNGQLPYLRRSLSGLRSEGMSGGIRPL